MLSLLLPPSLSIGLSSHSLKETGRPFRIRRSSRTGKSLRVDSQPVPEASNNLRERKDQDYRDQGYDDMIEQASQKHGVEPALIKAVIAAESGGNPNALSPAGAQGMMQLMPRTAAELGVINPFDPVENIMAGTRYLRQLLDRYLGNTRLALAAYNWGMGNLEKRPDAMPKETKNYIIKVESLYRTHMAASL